MQGFEFVSLTTRHTEGTQSKGEPVCLGLDRVLGHFGLKPRACLCPSPSAGHNMAPGRLL